MYNAECMLQTDQHLFKDNNCHEGKWSKLWYWCVLNHEYSSKFAINNNNTKLFWLAYIFDTKKQKLNNVERRGSKGM